MKFVSFVVAIAALFFGMAPSAVAQLPTSPSSVMAYVMTPPTVLDPLAEMAKPAAGIVELVVDDHRGLWGAVAEACPALCAGGSAKNAELVRIVADIANAKEIAIKERRTANGAVLDRGWNISGKVNSRKLPKGFTLEVPVSVFTASAAQSSPVVVSLDSEVSETSPSRIAPLLPPVAVKTIPVDQRPAVFLVVITLLGLLYGTAIVRKRRAARARAEKYRLGSHGMYCLLILLFGLTLACGKNVHDVSGPSEVQTPSAPLPTTVPAPVCVEGGITTADANSAEGWARNNCSATVEVHLAAYCMVDDDVHHQFFNDVDPNSGSVTLEKGEQTNFRTSGCGCKTQYDLAKGKPFRNGAPLYGGVIDHAYRGGKYCDAVSDPAPRPAPRQTPAPQPTPTPDGDDDDDGNGDDVALCHFPPGNPANHHTIQVGASAVPAHLRNHSGDYVGACTDEH